MVVVYPTQDVEPVVAGVGHPAVAADRHGVVGAALPVAASGADPPHAAKSYVEVSSFSSRLLVGPNTGYADRLVEGAGRYSLVAAEGSPAAVGVSPDGVHVVVVSEKLEGSALAGQVGELLPGWRGRVQVNLLAVRRRVAVVDEVTAAHKQPVVEHLSRAEIELEANR